MRAYGNALYVIAYDGVLKFTINDRRTLTPTRMPITSPTFKPKRKTKKPTKKYPTTHKKNQRKPHRHYVYQTHSPSRRPTNYNKKKRQ